jgi:predicted O-linked N-acetylglucosamine transferase (SPINDLY family)
MPLLKSHDHRNFEILCYSAAINPDPITGAFRRHTQQWRNIVGIGDQALADLIRRDGVDILVDLSQHTAGNRLPVFARQPAPVQVSFAGYPASTGMETIGYRISDRYLESEIETSTKERVCLIECFWCYDPCGMEAEVEITKRPEPGRVSFGSLNKFCKFNAPVFQLWARVLRKIRDSRLILLGGGESHRKRIVQFLERGGVDSHRVEFVEPRGRQAYLELYHRLDIVLDPFPYNGHTTSLDALWMGVPVVSLAGPNSVSRAALSQLSNLGLPELVAFSDDEYIDIAAQLALNPSRLAALRATLRRRMEASSLMDAPRFARNIEAAYRTMWRHWCSENPSSPR